MIVVLFYRFIVLSSYRYIALRFVSTSSFGLLSSRFPSFLLIFFFLHSLHTNSNNCFSLGGVVNQDGVVKLKWHPSSPLLFTACLDGCVRLWDGRTGSCEREFKGHRDGILDMAITPWVDIIFAIHKHASMQANCYGGCGWVIREFLFPCFDDGVWNPFRSWDINVRRFGHMWMGLG